MAGVGRLGRVTRKWAAEVSATGSAVVLLELAKDAADLADRNRGKDDRAYLAAAIRLRDLLGLVERDSSGGRPAGDEADGAWDRLVGSQPDPVVDSEDSRS